MWYVNICSGSERYSVFGWALFRIYKAEQLKKVEKTERTAARPAGHR